MTDYKLVPVEMIKRAAVTLERFAYDTFDGRNLAHELSELLTEAPAINIVATKNEQGQIVSVTLQDGDHRILEVIAEAGVQGEPVAVMYEDGSLLSEADCGDNFEICCKVQTPLYAAPQPAEQKQDVAHLVEALEGIMRVEARDRVMPVGAEWDAARAALAAYRKGGEV